MAGEEEGQRMKHVLISDRAIREFEALPPDPRLRTRLLDAMDRLALWPNVSGCHRLRHKLDGLWTLRVGHHRVVFRPDEAGPISVESVARREEVYEALGSHPR
jgi:mRNA-degrading endonuclease RelE of RelBE toxin-antitoxin system